MERRSPSVHAILVAVQVCFASLAVVGRVALKNVPPDAIILTRVAGGGVIFYLLARRRGPVGVARSDVPRLIACALLGVVINQYLFMHGLARTTAANASVLGTTVPVFTVLFAALSGSERLPPRRLAGVAVALAGALVLVRVDRFSWADAHAVGNLMVIANSLSYSLFLVSVRPLAARYAPITLVALLFLCALPLVAISGVGAWAELAPRLAGREALLLAYLVLVPTVFAYSLNQIALQRTEASLVAVYVNLQPLLATVGAIPIGEHPDARTFVAGGLVCAGVYLSARVRPSTPRHG